MPIRNFADPMLELLFRTGEHPRNIAPELAERIGMALDRLQAVTRLQDLHSPRSLRLTKAGSDQRFRIHVKDATWICFVWEHPDCIDVQLE